MNVMNKMKIAEALQLNNSRISFFVHTDTKVPLEDVAKVVAELYSKYTKRPTSHEGPFQDGHGSYYHILDHDRDNRVNDLKIEGPDVRTLPRYDRFRITKVNHSKKGRHQKVDMFLLFQYINRHKDNVEVPNNV